LNQVSFDIKKGELVAVVGPSGAGKTTLVHAMGGLIKPDSGSIMIDGQILDMNDDKRTSAYRNHYLGFVFQNYSLLPNYTVLDNIALPMVIAGVRPRLRKKTALAYLSAVGLDGFEKRRANELSGGQRQRVGIARALATRPKVIIADEPTGNLDSHRSHQIMTLLQTLSHKNDITIIVVTHDHHVAQLADHILYMHDGTIGESINAN
jgi:putative ABC transport system ATP-binding protein